MRKHSLSIFDDLLYAALLFIAAAAIAWALISPDDAHPLVSATDMVTTEPGKVDVESIAPQTPPPELFAGRP